MKIKKGLADLPAPFSIPPNRTLAILTGTKYLDKILGMTLGLIIKSTHKRAT